MSIWLILASWHVCSRLMPTLASVASFLTCSNDCMLQIARLDCDCDFRSLINLVDVSEIFFYLGGGGEGGARGEGGGWFFIENPRRGGGFSQERGGEGAGRVSAGRWGGGAIFFCRGRNSHQVNYQYSTERQKCHQV